MIRILKEAETKREEIFAREDPVGSVEEPVRAILADVKANGDEALKRYRDYKNTIDYAEEKGILKGKESTARNMKADGLSHSIIQKYTGLSLEDIEKL